MAEVIKPTGNPELRISYASLLSPVRPDRWLWGKNRWFVKMSEKLGYEGKVEAWMTRGVEKELSGEEPFLKPERVEILFLLGESIKSVHVNPEPDATIWKVLAQRKGSVWGGGKYGKENIAFADSSKAVKTIQRIQRLAENTGYRLPVVTYPHWGKDKYGRRRRTYGYYAPQTELVETHPEAFETEWGPQDYIDAVRNGVFGGVCVDTHHFFGKTPSGNVPFKKWEESLQRLFRAGVVEEFHFQPGRFLRVDGEGKSQNLEALRGVAAGAIQDQTLAKMIEMLGGYNHERIEQGKPPAPITTEITLPGLVATGVLPARSLFTYEGLAEAHRKIISAIREVY